MGTASTTADGRGRENGPGLNRSGRSAGFGRIFRKGDRPCGLAGVAGKPGGQGPSARCWRDRSGCGEWHSGREVRAYGDAGGQVRAVAAWGRNTPKMMKGPPIGALHPVRVCVTFYLTAIPVGTDRTMSRNGGCLHEMTHCLDGLGGLWWSVGNRLPALTGFAPPLRPSPPGSARPPLPRWSAGGRSRRGRPGRRPAPRQGPWPGRGRAPTRHFRSPGSLFATGPPCGSGV